VRPASKNLPAGLYSQARDFHQEKVMPTETKPELRARTFGSNLESDLAPKFLRVVEKAAIASARTMGQGDRKLADHVATEAMRATMDNIPMRGTIVIGEGERDEAPMLYIGEKVGASFPDGTAVPEVDIAVDPLEGTNLCATGAPGSITVLAASEKGGLLNAPDCYMEKIVVGPSCKGCVELDAPVADNLKNIAKRLERDVEDLVVIVLDRPRHEKLINDIRGYCGRCDWNRRTRSHGIGRRSRRRDHGGGHSLPEWLHAGTVAHQQAGTRATDRPHGN
jgi:hypothetical protein